MSFSLTYSHANPRSSSATCRRVETSNPCFLFPLPIPHPHERIPPIDTIFICRIQEPIYNQLSTIQQARSGNRKYIRPLDPSKAISASPVNVYINPGISPSFFPSFSFSSISSLNCRQLQSYAPKSSSALSHPHKISHLVKSPTLE